MADVVMMASRPPRPWSRARRFWQNLLADLTPNTALDRDHSAQKPCQTGPVRWNMPLMLEGRSAYR